MLEKQRSLQKKNNKTILWTYENLCGMLLYCKGGADMARITVEEVYGGEKYDVMSAVMADYLKSGRPKEYDERTWLDMLYRKTRADCSRQNEN